MDPTRTLSTFGGRLYSARKALEARQLRVITQQAAGEAAGVGQTAYGQWENDLKEPKSLAQIEQIARWFGVTPGWLAFGQEPRDPLDLRAALECLAAMRGQAPALPPDVPRERPLGKKPPKRAS